MNFSFMRAKKIYENIDFERGKDPKSAMGIGLSDYLVYDVQTEDDEEESYTYMINWDAISKFLREQMPGISDNEIDRFVSFELERAFQEMAWSRIKGGDLKEINDEIKNYIRRSSRHWMGMHSDKAMRQIARNSGLNI